MNAMTMSKNLLMQQGDCCKLLAACFYEPEKELFLQENLCENLAALLAADGCHAAAKAAKAMHASLQATDEEELKAAHAGLFIGPFELAAPPYGSIYLENTRRVMGDSTVAVQKLYRAAGLSLEVPEAPDHIALELEFMHFLIMAEADSVARNDRDEAKAFAATQAHFLRNYLAPWVFEFCAAIRKGTATGFYTSLADCLEGFIAVVAHLHKVTDFTSSAEETHACGAAV
jgi:TorA maturation chaperone TorD